MYDEDKLYGCVFGCPVQKRNKDCPFIEVEHFLIKEKAIWIESLNMEKRKSILEHHLICTKEREKE